MKTFKMLFLSVLVGTALFLGAIYLNSQRPVVETRQPTAELVKASGKCFECHSQETSAITEHYSNSKHAQKGINCLDCHQPVEGQNSKEHRGFQISTDVTSKNCATCHATEYTQFLQSRHAAPAWAAVVGTEGFTEEQIEYAEKFHPNTVKRPANELAKLEGDGVLEKGCLGCHAVGKPNSDGSIGSCTECHSAHRATIALARQPQTCGQCHMGPDHSQIEIYNESKHGALFSMLKDDMNLSAEPSSLTTQDMSVPTCATCHMSGLEGQKVTHNVTDRLSYYLFAPVSQKRPNYLQGQQQMKEVCLKCHATSRVEQFYKDAEVVVDSTNKKVQKSMDLVAEMKQNGLLTPAAFDEPADFLIFDLWHYYGRTAKHGAFMGGADFVQWHGNYELLLKYVELKKISEELLKEKGAHE